MNHFHAASRKTSDADARSDALAACGRSATRPPQRTPWSGRGPGWFESSWDLRCGLDVHEALLTDVSLNRWPDA